MWRKFRIVVLLFILATVVQQLWLEKKSLDWKHNFYVALYPVNADGSERVSSYLRSLQRNDFEPIAAYFATQAEYYQLDLRRPVELQLGAIVNEIPPAPPLNGSMLDTMIWSLNFKYFAWRHSPAVNVKPDIRLYLLYHDPITNPRLTHSTALNKGRIGRVNLFGDRSYAQQNAVIIAHELLHTLNATDKYDLTTTLPVYPDGYAEPQKTPLYPQAFAELMGGRIPSDEQHAVIPKRLDETRIGPTTALEIGWVQIKAVQ